MTTGPGFKEDIQPDKVPVSGPYNINSNALTSGTGLKVIQSYKVPGSDPQNKDTYALNTGDGFKLAQRIHPSKRETYALTKRLVQMKQGVANRKAAWPENLQRAIKEVLETQCVKP